MMTAKKRIRKIADARQRELEAANTVVRNLSDLKPGDVVWFATGFYKIHAVYTASPFTTVLKLIIPACRLLPRHIETHRIQGDGGEFPCRV